MGQGFGADGLGEVAMFEWGPLGEADEDVAGGCGWLVAEGGEEVGGEGKRVDAEDALDFVVVGGEFALLDGPGEGG